MDRAIGWMLAQQQADGSFGPIERMSHYMLTGAALLYTGHAEAAVRLIRALRKLYVRPEGGFDPPEIRAGHQGALIERGYAPSWMIYSSHVNLAFDISLPAMPQLLKLRDPATGGMFGSLEDAERGKGVIHTAVTSVACEAAIATGYLAEARRMADHVVDNVLRHNRDLSKALYPVWDAERGLRTDAATPAFPNMPPVLLRHAPHQHHYLTGMMIGALTDFYRVSREGKYLDAALEIYEFAAHGTPAIYESTASHKFAWGCAWLYRETGKAEHLESACRICDYLVSIQEPDGSFVHWAFVKSTKGSMSYKVAGIDIHKRLLMVVVATVASEVSDSAGEAIEFESRRFGTGSQERNHLVSWLQQHGVSEVVMESTAQYWKPVRLDLEAHFGKLHLAQAHSNRAPKGRKNDFGDAKRLATARRRVNSQL